MTMIVVSSPKGGCGKTTLAAGLAAELAARREVLLVALDAGSDFDLHFHQPGLDLAPGRFYRPAAEAEALWSAAEAVAPGLRAAALCEPNAPQPTFEAALAAIDGLGAPERLTIVDAPTLPFAHARALAAAGALIYVVAPDAAAMAAAPTRDMIGDDAGVFVCLNLVDPRRSLCRDIESLAAQAFGDHLAARIRFDAHVPDAAANGRLLRDFAPAAQAARDLRAFADLIDRRFALPAAREALSA